MSCTNDEELERLRQKKLGEMMPMTTTQYPDQPVKVTDDTFNEVLSRYPLVLVDFWAPWCGPCRAIAPVIEKLAKDWTGRPVFGKLNTDENPRMSQKFGITAIPSLLVFKNGSLVEEILGAVPSVRIESILKKHS